MPKRHSLITYTSISQCQVITFGADTAAQLVFDMFAEWHCSVRLFMRLLTKLKLNCPCRLATMSILLLRLYCRKQICSDNPTLMLSVDGVITGSWLVWSMGDPTVQQPGSDLQGQWSLPNWFHTAQGYCRATRKRSGPMWRCPKYDQKLKW